MTANSARTLDLTAPSRDMARITLHFDGVADSDSSSGQGRNGGVQVTLIDTDTHRGSFSSNGNEGGGPGLGTPRSERSQRRSHSGGPAGAL